MTFILYESSVWLSREDKIQAVATFPTILDFGMCMRFHDRVR